ncbi:MAG: aminotransferase class IV [Desulfovibrio sp.]|nr:aminotransferase class IV [Desulfovibrio sp.]
MRILEGKAFVDALFALSRPGAEHYLAFYDHRLKAVCNDPHSFFIPLDDHICHRGDGLFESICFRKGRIFALEAHMERMRQGAEALSLVPPCTWEEMPSIILEVVRSVHVPDGDIRVFLSRGPGGFGISPKECPTAGFYVVVLKAHLEAEERYAKGISAFTSRIPPKQPYLARIKNTNYLPNVFMAKEAEEKGKDVAVSFDEHGIMGEAAIANIALITKDDLFVCPKLTSILAGTTLLTAMEIVQERMPCVERDISHDDIWEAREILLLTSSKLCVAITEFDGKKIGEGEMRGKPGPISVWLKKRLFEVLYESGSQL